jgi:proteasome assembly chaperone (PAC2) family protein
LERRRRRRVIGRAYLIESGGATALAEIDPEPFTDFATVRPQVRLDQANRRQIIWPTVGVWSMSAPGADVVLILGPEPALRWRSFCEQIVGIARAFDSPLALTLGALLADVPHTRPVQLIGTATDHELVERFDLERSRYEGPTGIVGVLQHALTEAGIPSASLWAAVPGYASQIPSPKAAIALVERACSIMGTPAPLARLAAQAAEYEARVGALVATTTTSSCTWHASSRCSTRWPTTTSTTSTTSTPATTSPTPSTPSTTHRSRASWSRRSSSSSRPRRRGRRRPNPGRTVSRCARSASAPGRTWSAALRR